MDDIEHFKSTQCYEDKPICHGLKPTSRFFLWNFLVKPLYKFFLVVETREGEKKPYSQSKRPIYNQKIVL